MVSRLGVTIVLPEQENLPQEILFEIAKAISQRMIRNPPITVWVYTIAGKLEAYGSLPAICPVTVFDETKINAGTIKRITEAVLLEVAFPFLRGYYEFHVSVVKL